MLNLSESEREALAIRLCQEIDATEQIRQALKPRWDRCEQIYVADETATTLNVVDGIATYPFSLWRGKCDKLVGDLVSGLLSASPVIQCIVEEPDGTNEGALEKALDQLAEKSGFWRCLPKATTVSANTNIGVYRTRPKVDKKGFVTGIECDWIHPKHFMAYPVSYERLDQVRTTGHRFYQPKYEVAAKQEVGEYYPGEINAGDDPDAYDHLPGRQDRNDSNTVVDIEDGYVECWELVTTQVIRRRARKVVCVVAKSSQALLSCYPFGPSEDEEYERTWYEIQRLCQYEKRIFTNDSVANSVQGYCLAAQDLLNAIVAGAYATAYPAVWMKGYMGPQQAKKYNVGEIIPLGPEGDMGVLGLPFDAGKFAGALEKFEQLVDATVGISRNGSSQNLPPTTTATAINGLLQTDQRRQATYLDAASEAVEGVYAILLMFLKAYPRELATAYGGALLGLRPEMLMKQYRLEVTGKSGASNPGMLLQKLQMALQMSAAPMSNLDYGKVEDRVMDAMDLPFNTVGLQKDAFTAVRQTFEAIKAQGVDPMQALAAGLQMMEANGQLAQIGSGGQPGSPGGAVQGAGVGDGQAVPPAPPGPPGGGADPMQPGAPPGTAGGDRGAGPVPASGGPGHGF